ncbi:MAG: hypothetical protein WC510_00885 [Candidatus Omnitrophota bacterium]
MGRDYLKSSLTFKSFSGIAKTHSIVLFWYRNSWICEKSIRFSEVLLICLRMSFLGRISEIKPEGNYDIAGNSKAMQYLLLFYDRVTKRATHCLLASKTYITLVGLSREFNRRPVKALGVVILAATLVNIAVSLLFAKEILFMGWLIRGVFIFVGLGSLYCPAGWEELFKENFLLRHINNCCKSKS